MGVWRRFFWLEIGESFDGDLNGIWEDICEKGFEDWFFVLHLQFEGFWIVGFA